MSEHEERLIKIKRWEERLEEVLVLREGFHNTETRRIMAEVARAWEMMIQREHMLMETYAHVAATTPSPQS